MNKPACTLALTLALGCTPGYVDTIEEGAHIDLEIEAGLEPCGDLVGHMDRFIELVAGVLGVDLRDRHYTYRWLTPKTYSEESGCPEGSLGCAFEDMAVSFAAPVDHELVHLVSFAVNRPPSFFIEGLAVALDVPGISIGGGTPGTHDLRDLLAIDRTPPGGYLLAGAYTRLLIDRFGMAAYLDFYASLDGDADLETIATTHEDIFAEPLDATIAVFDAERRECEFDRFRVKLFECAAPRLAWQGDTLTLRRNISCADDDVVGPFFFGPDAVTYATLEITDAGLHELSAITDRLGAQIQLGSCGGCESPAPLDIYIGAGPRRVDLEAGTYYLALAAQTSADTLLSLQLRRVAE